MEAQQQAGIDPSMSFTLNITSEYAGWMTIRPDPQGLSAARGKVRSVVDGLGLSGEDRVMLILAVGEALSNAYLHGTPDPDNNFIRLAWQVCSDTFIISIHDEGPGIICVNRNISSPKINGSGCGMNIMHNGVDEIDYHFDCGTRVTLTKYLGVARRESAARMQKW